MDRQGILKLITELRSEGRALQGDGFGIIGDAKSTYKKAAKTLEELLVLTEKIQQGKGIEVEQGNCWGTGADNLPTCSCRLIYLDRQ